MIGRKIWFNGAIVPVDQAKVNVLSPTAQYGINVFEGIRCYKSARSADQLLVFRLSDHLRRLMGSARLMGIVPPYSVKELEQYLTETIAANDYHDDTIVRMTLFVDGEGSWNSTEPVGMFIAPILKKRGSATLTHGLKACVSTWQRIHDNSLPPRVKAGANYLNGRYAHLEARRQGCDVPLLLGHDGKLAEGAGACVFIYRDGALATPPPTSSTLESITRATLLELAREAGIQVNERPVDRTELYLADEVFLCGTAAEVSPIVSVDNFTVGCGQAGPVTLALLEAYLLAASDAKPSYSHWLTPVYVQTHHHSEELFNCA